MKRIIALASAVGLTLAAGSGAGANTDDASAAVATKLADAGASVSSFVVRTHINGTTGSEGTLTYVRSQGTHFHYAIGRLSMETYVVAGTLYVQAPTGDWKKLALDAAQSQAASPNLAQAVRASDLTVLPDRSEDGTIVGVLRLHLRPGLLATTSSAGALIGHDLTCSYDKANFHLRVCANDAATMTYSHYDDPANRVVLPAAARSAAAFTLPLGPASAAPSADPSAPPPGSPSPDASSTPQPAAPVPPLASPATSPTP